MSNDWAAELDNSDTDLAKELPPGDAEGTKGILSGLSYKCTNILRIFLAYHNCQSSASRDAQLIHGIAPNKNSPLQRSSKFIQ